MDNDPSQTPDAKQPSKEELEIQANGIVEELLANHSNRNAIAEEDGIEVTTVYANEDGRGLGLVNVSRVDINNSFLTDTEGFSYHQRGVDVASSDGTVESFMQNVYENGITTWAILIDDSTDISEVAKRVDVTYSTDPTEEHELGEGPFEEDFGHEVPLDQKAAQGLLNVLLLAKRDSEHSRAGDKE